jgi:predicted HNH restriction endonuclease
MKLIKKNDHRCELCGVEKRGKETSKLQVHHLKPSEYTRLDESAFILLCASCHRNLLERLLKRKEMDIDDFCEKLRNAYNETEKD